MTKTVHLGYCSNIHPGETWSDHVAILQKSIPIVKASVSPDAPMGIGLRLANQASLDILEAGNLSAFQRWLSENDCYVFTMNGFPYGGFHNVRVKDQVHAPDWTTPERTAYTIRLFGILAQLLPEHLSEGGISTSPLSYRFWWKTPEALETAIQTATQNLLLVLDELIKIRRQTGKILHLDIEPEPDGILENSDEFIQWYQNTLLPLGIKHLQETQGIPPEEATEHILNHIQLCYDVCHVAVSYEEPKMVLDNLAKAGIRVGKIQISSALKVDLAEAAEQKIEALRKFDEPTYLHQVVARTPAGTLDKYPDLPEALAAFSPGKHVEWRIHFHVPIFLATYGMLESTQADIVDTLRLQQKTPFTQHLEAETYTWGVLPTGAQVPLDESIVREMQWVKGILKEKR
ncbi:MAG: metabolite traffic protein EboE [Cytophagaceae bacterium]|nr:metabolite traffic protein EboE [Cytophagaceae bacterium]